MDQPRKETSVDEVFFRDCSEGKFSYKQRYTVDVNLHMNTFVGAPITFLRKLLPKSILKHIPEPMLLLYHRVINALAVVYYRRPSRKLIIVGVTGTNGKTTTTFLIRDLLMTASVKTGLLGTTEIAVGDEKTPNDMHNTMPGRGFIHMQLKKMVDAGCAVAVVETTSEGIKQYRHEGIEYDILVFTNLTPEHLQAHGGSFEKYKQTKMSLFENLHKRFRKANVPKVILANVDDAHGTDFLQNKADKRISYGIESGDIRPMHISTKETISFSLHSEKNTEEKYTAPLIGRFNVYNALAAVLVAKELGLKHMQIASGLKHITGIPGRMEGIDEGQDFHVFLDFAHEGVGIQNAFGALQRFREKHKVIGLVGGVGGGRDRRNRFEVGKAAAELSDILIVTTQDPYDDDPEEIIHDIISSAEKILTPDKTLFAEVDRREGIRRALSFAETGDAVIIAGRGAELSMIVRGKAIPWDERQAVRDELRILLKNEYAA